LPEEKKVVEEVPEEKKIEEEIVQKPISQYVKQDLVS